MNSAPRSGNLEKLTYLLQGKTNMGEDAARDALLHEAKVQNVEPDSYAEHAQALLDGVLSAHRKGHLGHEALEALRQSAEAVDRIKGEVMELAGMRELALQEAFLAEVPSRDCLKASGYKTTAIYSKLAEVRATGRVGQSSTSPEQALQKLKSVADRYAEADERLHAAENAREDAVRRAFQEGVRSSDIAAATGLSHTWLYKIRDGKV